MKNSYVLSRIRTAFQLDNNKMLEVFALAKNDTSFKELQLLLDQAVDDNKKDCGANILSDFLDGLITDRRGPSDAKKNNKKKVQKITNNTVLKKLRIALDMKEEAILAVFEMGEVELTALELGSFFRKHGNKHYRACDDRLLDLFFDGLELKLSE